MSERKPNRTREEYLAQLKRSKAERLINAVQEAARTGEVLPFKKLCWALKSQENKRIKRAKQRRDAADIEGVITSIIDNAFSHMKRSRASRPIKKERRRAFAEDSQVLAYRNPLNLSPGYGITAMHVACQLYARSVVKNDHIAMAALEEVVGILVRLGASPTLLMRDGSGREVSCMELCPRKPGGCQRQVPKALAAYFATSVENAPVTHAVKKVRHEGVQKALLARRERQAVIPEMEPMDLGRMPVGVWTRSAVSGRALAPSFTR